MIIIFFARLLYSHTDHHPAPCNPIILLCRDYGGDAGITITVTPSIPWQTVFGHGHIVKIWTGSDRPLKSCPPTAVVLKTFLISRTTTKTLRALEMERIFQCFYIFFGKQMPYTKGLQQGVLRVTTRGPPNHTILFILTTWTLVSIILRTVTKNSRSTSYGLVDRLFSAKRFCVEGEGDDIAAPLDCRRGTPGCPVTHFENSCIIQQQWPHRYVWSACDQTS